MRARYATFVLALALALAAPTTSRVRGQAVALDTITRLTQIDVEIAQALSDVERAEAEGARVEAELGGMSTARAGGSRRISDRTRALYRLSRAGALPVAGGFEALLGHAARVERLTRMLERDVEEMQELSRRELALREETEAARTRVEHAHAHVAELEAEKAQLLETSGELSAFDVALAGAIEIPPAGGAMATGDEGFGIRFSDTGESVGGPSGFEARRGELALPIAAPTSVHDATREEGSGIELVGTRGATVRAAAAGHVAYADRHPGYGSLVIVDHGGSYFTVYGGLGTIDTQVGDEMPRAGRLGSVGTGAIFFQVRRGTRPLDAHAWLGI